MTETAHIARDPKPDLIDVVIALIVCSATIIFVFWLATQFMKDSAFQQIPDFVKSSFSAVFSVLAGAGGIGAAVVRDLNRKPETRPDYLRLFGIVLIVLFVMILMIIILIRMNPQPSVRAETPAIQNTPAASTVRSLKPQDQFREGWMRNISVTIVKKPGENGTFNISFQWTGGGGGTWSGNQSVTFTFVDKNGAALQSVSMPIDRSHCFYNGGQTEGTNGNFIVDADLVADVKIALSEVNNRREGAC